jgi:hypothetical protein
LLADKFTQNAKLRVVPFKPIAKLLLLLIVEFGRKRDGREGKK